MTRRLVVRAEAEADLAEAFDWYEDKREGLGADFLLQVDAGLEFIRRYPEAHPIEYKQTRKHLIRRFPYKIIYLLTEDALVVLAVVHVKRSPGYLRRIIDRQ